MEDERQRAHTIAMDGGAEREGGEIETEVKEGDAGESGREREEDERGS